jgi:hypothetical protein
MTVEAPSGPRNGSLRAQIGRAFDHVSAWALPRFSELGGPGTCVAPIVLTGAVSVWTATVLHPLVASAYADDPGGIAAGIQSLIWLLAVLSPLLALAKAGVLGTAGWGVLVLAGGRPRFLPLVSALLYGEVILALQGAWVAFVLRLRGTGSISRPADLKVVTGPAELLPDGPPALMALAQGLSVFHVAWLVFLTLAFAYLARTSKMAGLAAAASVGMFFVGFGVLRAVLA